MTGVFIEREGQFGHREETTEGTPWEDRSCADTSQGTTGSLSEAWTDPPLVPAERMRPCPLLGLGHLPPGL